MMWSGKETITIATTGERFYLSHWVWSQWGQSQWTVYAYIHTLWCVRKRKKPATILKKNPDAILADVTSQADTRLKELSRFFPHHDIPVPFTDGYTATCVEAIWQGLKFFESCDVDVRCSRMIQWRKGIRGRFSYPLWMSLAIPHPVRPWSLATKGTQES